MINIIFYDQKSSETVAQRACKYFFGCSPTAITNNTLWASNMYLKIAEKKLTINLFEKNESSKAMVSSALKEILRGEEAFVFDSQGFQKYFGKVDKNSNFESLVI